MPILRFARPFRILIRRRKRSSTPAGTPDRASDAEWADYLFYRDNVKGLHLERWVHSFGCRQWFNVVRDTATHEIVEVVRMGNPVETPLPGKGNASG